MPVECDGVPAVLRRTADALRKVVPYDAGGWFATDVQTLLPARPMLLEPAGPGPWATIWGSEGLISDPLSFLEMSRSGQSVLTLQQTTGSNPDRSARYRELIGPLGYGDELRALIRSGDRTWGVVDLLRMRGGPPFSQRETQRVLEVLPTVAARFAEPVLIDGIPLPRDHGPGTVVFDANGSLTFLDAQARRWFTHLAGPDWAGSETWQTMVGALLARARCLANGQQVPPAAVNVRTDVGLWLHLHASCMRGSDGFAQLDTVVVQPASAAHLTAAVLESHGLTRREQDIAREAACGRSNAEIAAMLSLSRFTVSDHLKAIFLKLGVRSRGQLTARMLLGGGS